MSYLVFWEGLGYVIGSKKGQHLVLGRRPSLRKIKRMSKPTAYYDARPGYLQFAAPDSLGEESLEFLTTTPEAKFDTDFQPALSVAFKEPSLEGTPIIRVLNDMRSHVEGVLLTFEKHFFP
jgi:hypothetical protein